MADPAPFEDAVKDLVEQVQMADPQVSDLISVVDGTTIQWVDFVLAGGGMLGIAHVGFTYLLEKAGIRFRGIAGTSAGAINAALIVALRPNPAGESGTETVKHLASAPFSQFMDGDEGIKELQEYVLGKIGGSSPPKTIDEKKGGGIGNLLQILNPLRFFRWVGLLPATRFIGPILEIVKNRGMYKGAVFEKWMAGLMSKRAPTVDDLYKCLQLPPLQIRKSRSSQTGKQDARLLDNTKGDLAIIASDITTETKAVFPKHAELYYENSGKVSPSEFVRMSMSIPVFFQPKEVGVPLSVISSGIWKTAPGVEYQGTFPDPGTEDGPFKGKVKVTFVDGGTLSNFPINHFHNKGVPLLPTLGVRLSPDRNNYSDTSDLVHMSHAMNNASRHILDREFLYDNPDYSKLISTIDTAGFNWLDFNMKQEEQVRLFKRGAEAAAKFLLGFDWESYKSIRAQLAALNVVVPEARRPDKVESALGSTGGLHPKEWQRRLEPTAPKFSAIDSLCKAAGSGDIARAVAQLRGGEVEVSAADEQGWTPLHAAVQAGYLEMASFLLELGALPTVKTLQGVTPLNLAVDAGNSDMAAMLQEWMDLKEVRCPYQHNVAEAAKWLEAQIAAGMPVICLDTAWLIASDAKLEPGSQMRKMLESKGYMETFGGSAARTDQGVSTYERISDLVHAAANAHCGGASEAEPTDSASDGHGTQQNQGSAPSSGQGGNGDEPERGIDDLSSRGGSGESSGRQSGNQETGREGGQDDVAAEASGSPSICDRERCSTVKFEPHDVSDTAAFAEGGVTVGEGSLEVDQNVRARLTWEQNASFKRHYYGRRRNIKVQAVATINCCTHGGLTCITLEELRGSFKSTDGVLGLTMDSVTIEVDAKRDGDPLVMRMEPEGPVTCSKGETKHTYVRREHYWELKLAPSLRMDILGQSGEIGIGEFNRNIAVVDEYPRGTRFELTSLQSETSPLSTLSGQGFELTRNVEATLLCQAPASGCALLKQVLLLDSGCVAGQKLEMKFQVAVRWSSIAELWNEQKMFAKVVACHRAHYNMLFRKEAHLYGTCLS